MSPRFLDRQVVILGARFPMVAVALASLILVSTILGANLPGFADLFLMPPALVWSGQVWRVLTWSLFEFQALSLIFACLTILFFGRELAYAWGAGGFLKVCAGIVIGSGAITCLIARFVWPGLLPFPYWSAWALGESLIIAYGMMFPARTILLYFVVPLAGRNLVIATVAGTLLFALLSGFPFFVPHFIAQGLMYAYLRGYSPRLLWLMLRARTVRWKPGKRPSYIRPVDRNEPPRWVH